MTNNVYKSLLKRYSDYTRTFESQVVFLVKQFSQELDTKRKWIDVVSYDYRVRDYGRSGFNYMVVELFDRKIFPKYPKKTDEESDAEYTALCRAITWEVSHEDIHKQRLEGKRGPIYLFVLRLYNKNRGKKKIIEKPFWNEEYGGFDHTGKVPTTTKKYEVDMDPVWEYQILGLKEIDDALVDQIKRNFDRYIYDKILTERRIEVEWFFVDYDQQARKAELQEKNQQKKTSSPKTKSKDKKKSCRFTL